jgi:hypothetical protein
MVNSRTHLCTSCNKVMYYDNLGSWRNAKTKLTRTGVLRCPQCAGKEGRESSSVRPTGRPVGSKNKDNTRVKLANVEKRKYLKLITKEQRRKGIAKRNGYESYEEYQATLTDWEKYKNEVWRLTNAQPLHLLENFDKRGPSGQEGAYQIDHIYSILKGFKNSVPPALIADIKNLEMLPWLDNVKKGWK